VLDESTVSRTHAQIRLRFGHYVIFDTDSQTGTFVNNVRIREHRLRAGDVIRVGKTSLVYMEDDPEQLDETNAFHSI
jgi:pSer/pThr/pTyr-binding forkhead associated (FHA) protein